MISRTTLLLIELLLILCVFPTHVLATTYPAATCSVADINTAIGLASDGDTVTVPAGNCTWSSDVSITNKGITLQGNGTGSTNITYSFTPGTNDGILEINNDDTGSFRITGFTFKGDTGTNNGKNRVIDILGTDKSWRIDNCDFEDGYSGSWKTGIAIFINGYTNGVIDHCNFTTAAKEVIQVLDNGGTAWSRASSFGGSDNVFIEDCVFTNTSGDTGAVHQVLGEGGGRYVFRYNTASDGDIDAHGYCGNPAGGTRHYEIYNNTFSATMGRTYGFYLRGGTGVVYNNTINNAGDLNIVYALTVHRIQRSTCGFSICCCVYPCDQQIGRGLNEDTLDPLYIWNNTIDGVPVIAELALKDFAPDGCAAGGECGVAQNQADYIQENRDYYLSARPGYTPYTYPHPLNSGEIVTVIDIGNFSFSGSIQ